MVTSVPIEHRDIGEQAGRQHPLLILRVLGERPPKRPRGERLGELQPLVGQPAPGRLACTGLTG